MHEGVEFGGGEDERMPYLAHNFALAIGLLVIELDVSRQISEPPNDQESTKGGPLHRVAWAAAKIVNRLALLVEEGGLGGHESVDGHEMLTVRRPLDIVNGAILQLHQLLKAPVRWNGWCGCRIESRERESPGGDEEESAIGARRDNGAWAVWEDRLGGD